METITKAITFQLLPLTKSKKESLEKIAENFKLIYDMTSMRLPSTKNIHNKHILFILEKWRQEWLNKTFIHSQISQQAMDLALDDYKIILTKGESVSSELSSSIIRVHNQSWKFKKQNNRLYLIFPDKKFKKRKYTYLYLPIKNSHYYDDAFINNIKFGEGQINLSNQTFTTYIKVPIKSSLDYIPETFIGIDMGKNNLAVAVVTNKDSFKESKFWSGNENRHIRKSFDKYRKDVAKIGRPDLIEDSTHYEHNWMKNVNHNISKQIIEIAKKYPKPIIIMENLHRFAKFKWNFYQLRQMIEYKVTIEGIRTTLINPAYTSQTCPKCNHIDKLNRTGIHFKCIKCNYQNNADFVGAWNISKIDSNKWILKNKIKTENIESKVIGNNENTEDIDTIMKMFA